VPIQPTPSRTDRPVPLLLVRFEQGRGRTGVPTTFVPYLAGAPGDPQAEPTVETLVWQAVQFFRAACADANQGHGRDLMPGDDGEYQLHNLDGGRVLAPSDIRWTVRDGKTFSELVLTWRNPASLLAEQARIDV
jgi:hypothetical protein